MNFSTVVFAPGEAVFGTARSGIPSLEEIQTLRNRIFARHGYPFQNEKWRKLFYKPPRVKEDFLYEAGWQKKTKWVHVGFRENPHYQDSLLTPKEKKFADLLLAEEKKRR